MAGNARANKARNQRYEHGPRDGAPWFKKQKARSDKRRKQEKKSRRKNRGC